jgi:hypothetical protein
MLRILQSNTLPRNHLLPVLLLHPLRLPPLILELLHRHPLTLLRNTLLLLVQGRQKQLKGSRIVHSTLRLHRTNHNPNIHVLEARPACFPPVLDLRPPCPHHPSIHNQLTTFFGRDGFLCSSTRRRHYSAQKSS